MSILDFFYHFHDVVIIWVLCVAILPKQAIWSRFVDKMIAFSGQGRVEFTDEVLVGALLLSDHPRLPGHPSGQHRHPDDQYSQHAA